MPSHKIHIKLAQDINQKLKLDNDSIMLGSVLPDLTIDKDHGLSHFQYKDEYPYNLANADEFIRKYPNMKDDISIGYIIHLLTDRFYNDYLYKHYTAKGISVNKELKSKLYSPYEDYLLNSGVIKKFNNFNVITKTPNYNDLKFDMNYLKKYIKNFNNEVDSSKKNSSENIDFANTIYNDCLNYISCEIKKYL